MGRVDRVRDSGLVDDKEFDEFINNTAPKTSGANADMESQKPVQEQSNPQEGTSDTNTSYDGLAGPSTVQNPYGVPVSASHIDDNGVMKNPPQDYSANIQQEIPEAYVPPVQQPQPNAYQQPQPNAYQQPQPNAYQQPQPNAYQQPQPNAYQQPQPNAYQQPQQVPVYPGAEQMPYVSPFAGGQVPQNQSPQQVPVYQQQVPVYPTPAPAPQAPGGQNIPPAYGTPGQQQSQPYMNTQPASPRTAPQYQYSQLTQPQSGYKVYDRKCIAIHSPKGGVGKSSLTKELAYAYSTASINGQPLRVLVVDFDWEFGDMATILGVKNQPNCVDWARQMLIDKKSSGRIPLYEKRFVENNYIQAVSENLFILASSANPTDAAFIDSEIVSAMIDNLRHCDFDVILFDNANSIKAKTVTVLNKADDILLVETLDTSTITETTTLFAALRNSQFDRRKVKMVLNQVPVSHKSMDLHIEEIPRILDLPLVAVIPDVDSVRISNNAAESLLTGKENDFTRAVKKAANSIIPIYNEEKSGFFSRLFKK